MEIKSAEFITSMAEYTDRFPGAGLRQVAICGKSNVGKSSLINRLCRRNKLARTSSTPGKTRLINVFLLNGAFHLIDLPGYGFAKVDKQEKPALGRNDAALLYRIQGAVPCAASGGHPPCAHGRRRDHEASFCARWVSLLRSLPPRRTKLPGAHAKSSWLPSVGRCWYSPGKSFAFPVRTIPVERICWRFWKS